MYHATINGKKKLDLEWDQKKGSGMIDGQIFTADVHLVSPDKTHWISNDKSYNVELVQLDNDSKEALVKVNGRIYQVLLKDRYDDLLKSLGMEGSTNKRLKELKAPMPGLVLEILVKEGQEVEKDTPLLILEAMKMENMIKSPASGIVKKVNAIKGNAVEKNNILIEFQ